jgi:hypothetical protein
MCLISSSLLTAYEFVTRHLAIVLVLIGVLGEGVELVLKIWWEHVYKKYERKIDVAAFIFWAIVIIGLGCEIPDAVKTDRETANLETTNAQLVASNLEAAMKIEEMRSNNIEDELQLSPRLIEQEGATTRMKEFSGLEVAIIFGMGSDCAATAGQLTTILREAGWKVSSVTQTFLPLQTGVVLGTASTDGQWPSGLGAKTPDKPLADLQQQILRAGSALVDELHNDNITADMSGWINRRSNLRFNGMLIEVGPKETVEEMRRKKAQERFKAELATFSDRALRETLCRIQFYVARERDLPLKGPV